MLTNTLNTNEVKDAAAAAISFSRISISDRSTEFAKVGETPAQSYRLKIAHQQSGAGIKLRRRSVVRFDKTVISSVDSVTPVTVSGYFVMDAPIGALTSGTEMANVVANVLSFCATTGAATAVLFDGTGNGAVCLLSGGL